MTRNLSKDSVPLLQRDTANKAESAEMHGYEIYPYVGRLPSKPKRLQSHARRKQAVDLALGSGKPHFLYLGAVLAEGATLKDPFSAATKKTMPNRLMYRLQRDEICIFEYSNL